MRLAQSAKNLDVLNFFSHVNSMSLWPPAFPLMECPIFLVFGYDYTVARGFISILFALCIFAIFLVGLELDSSRGVLLGALAAALMSISPLYHLFGTLVMLEIPGTLLLLLAALSYIRYLKTDTKKDLKLFCLTTVVLFFCKYNYGLMWILPVGLNEIWRAAPSLNALKTGLSKLIQFGKSRPLFSVFLILYMSFLLGIVISGGWIWNIAGQRISITSVGNPIYFFFCFLFLLFLIKPKKYLVLARKTWRKTEQKFRMIFLFVCIPIFIWMLVPSHMKGFVSFLENRSSELPFFSADNLLFYPQAFIKQYSPSFVVGLIVFVLGFFPIFFLRRHSSTSRVVYLAITVGLLFSLFHPYKLARFIFTVAPFLWLSCAQTITYFFGFLFRRNKSTVAAKVRLIFVFVCLSLALYFGYQKQRLQSDFNTNTVSANVRPILNTLTKFAQRSKGTVILGLWDRLSPGLVEWHCRLQIPGIEADKIPKSPQKYSRTLTPSPLLDNLFENQNIERIIFLGLDNSNTLWSKAFFSENNWLPPVKNAIKTDSRFFQEEELLFPKSGYRLTLYRKSAK